MMNFSMRLLTTCVAAATAVGVGVPASQAVTVQITDGVGAGTTVFDSGGFESSAYTVGSTPGTSDASIGTWELGPNASFGVKTLTGATTTNQNGDTAAGPTGAYSGTNYETSDRSGPSGNANTFITGSFTQDISLADSSFEIEFAYWVAGGQYGLFGVGSDSLNRVGSNYDHSHMAVAFDDRDTQGNPNAINPLDNGQANLGSLNLGQWNEVTYTWDHLNQTNTLTVNGTDYIIDKPSNSTNTMAGEFTFAAGSDIAVFVDAVPEPGSMALISLGGMLMLRRKRSA